MSQNHQTDMLTLWATLHETFCVDLKAAFSNQDALRWLAHFVPHHPIDVHQNGKDMTGKTGQGKCVRVYTGGWLASLFKGRIPAKMMATILFKRLAKQQYSHSDIDLLGIQFNQDHDGRANALVSFKRYNQSGEAYDAAVGIYSMMLIDGAWLICEISMYDSLDQISSQRDIQDFWKAKS